MVLLVGLVKQFTLGTCLHIACFFFYLAVEIVLQSIFVDELFKFVNVLLVEFDIPLHVAKVRAIALQLAIPTSLQTFRLSRLPFKLLLVLRLFAFELFV